MVSVFSQMFELPVFPEFLVTPNLLVEIPALQNGDLCDHFSKATNPIRPIILSHGLGAHANFYTAGCHMLAAHGFLVVALNH